MIGSTHCWGAAAVCASLWLAGAGFLESEPSSAGAIAPAWAGIQTSTVADPPVEPIPAWSSSAYVLVDVPRARLWMIRQGRVEGSMRVIVGRPDQPTPDMATEITHVVLHPHWNVPQDILRSQLAREAARTGGRSLTEAGYEVMSSWRDDAVRISVATIDWRAVAAGRLEVPVRQRPGRSNAMGRAKFVMTNDAGIYLHDTPDRDLFGHDARAFSAGCIRVEDYDRLLAFLIPDPLPPVASTDRPTYVRLGEPVPIYVTSVSTLEADFGPMTFAGGPRRGAGDMAGTRPPRS